MVELRQAAAELIANPLVPVPPLEGVVARARAIKAARRRRQMGASVTLAALVVTAVVRAGLLAGTANDSLRTVGNPAADDSVVSGGVPPLGDHTTVFPTLPWSGQSFEGDWSTLPDKRACPVVREAKPELRVLLDDAVAWDVGDDDAVEAVAQYFDAVNRAGGICGRHVKLVHDALRRADLQRFVAVVGLPLGDELDAAIAGGHIAKARVPVVSGDALTQAQHRSPLVYPVGPSAASMTRAAVDHGRTRGATSFAVVYDAQHAFGREAAAAFHEHVQRRGGTVKASIGLDATSTDYAVDARHLATACGSEGCDFVLLAVVADTAKQWLKTNPTKPRLQLAGLSPMLADGFTDHCATGDGRSCDGLVAWSGYRPLVGSERWDAEVSYAWGHTGGSALRQGGVVAARVLHQALRIAGPDATKADVQRALESMTFTSRVTPALSWAGGRFLDGHPVAQGWALRSDDLATVPTPGTTPERLATSTPPVHRLFGPAYWFPAGTGWVRDPG